MTDNKKLRAIFMGTPDFAVPCLEKLLASDFIEVIGVVTQPDKAKGRGKKFLPPPVKACALNANLTVHQPQKIRNDSEFIASIAALKPDLAVVVAFGQILPLEFLNIFPCGVINVHASLLPRYRGAAPIQRAIIDGEKITGVTTMLVDVGLDTGDMLEKSIVEIGDDMTFGELHDKLASSGADLLMVTLEKLIDGALQRTKQDDSLSNYAPMIQKDTGRIDWTKSATEIHNLVRGLDPVPGAFTTLDGEVFKIWKTRVERRAESGERRLNDNHSESGTIIEAGKSLVVKCGDGIIEIAEIQAPNKKRLNVADYLRGHKINPPAKFI